MAQHINTFEFYDLLFHRLISKNYQNNYLLMYFFFSLPSYLMWLFVVIILMLYKSMLNGILINFMIIHRYYTKILKYVL